MALSGTTLTVTTLTTPGLLTNNTSGQISTVTGSSLGSLLGGSPTFAGLTLSGLTSTMLKTNSSNGIVAAVAGTDYQIPVTGSTNITVNPSTGVISTSTSPVFTTATLSGISGSMLKTVSGVITGAIAYTDYTPAITAPSGSNLTINTSLNTISVVNPPVFSNIANSTIGTNNVLHGTGSGAGLTTGSANSLYGSSAGANLTTGSNSTIIGYNAGANLTTGSNSTISGYNAGANLTTGSNSTIIGYNAGASLTTGSNSTIIGYNAGDVLATGSNGLYIGNGSTASSSSVSNEGVINVSGSTATGRGADTLFINASAGLYSYSPTSCFLYATGISNGRLQWANYSSNNPIRGFTLGNYGNGINTAIIPNFNAVYEITISGAYISNGVNAYLNLNNVNIKNDTVFWCTYATNGYAFPLSCTSQCRPYTTVSSSGFEVQVFNMGLYGVVPIWISIKFISL